MATRKLTSAIRSVVVAFVSIATGYGKVWESARNLAGALDGTARKDFNARTKEIRDSLRAEIVAGTGWSEATANAAVSCIFSLTAGYLYAPEATEKIRAEEPNYRTSASKVRKGAGLSEKRGKGTGNGKGNSKARKGKGAKGKGAKGRKAPATAPVMVLAPDATEVQGRSLVGSLVARFGADVVTSWLAEVTADANKKPTRSRKGAAPKGRKGAAKGKK